jgi:hypothetical protein
VSSAIAEGDGRCRPFFLAESTGLPYSNWECQGDGAKLPSSELPGTETTTTCHHPAYELEISAMRSRPSIVGKMPELGRAQQALIYRPSVTARATRRSI